VAGVVDAFRARGRKIVGPDRAAAQLEGSKVFAKNFLIRVISHGRVRRGGRRTRRSTRTGPLRLPGGPQSDGLAAGKGVVIAHGRAEAEAALSTLRGRLVIEEFLTGEEVSFIALCDGRNVLPLAPTQDHKAVFDGDAGRTRAAWARIPTARFSPPRRAARFWSA